MPSQIELPNFTDANLSPGNLQPNGEQTPCTCTLPNLPNDGYMFYNFSVEQDDPDFIRQFILAINRTIMFVEQNPNRFENEDVADLHEFLDYVKAL